MRLCETTIPHRYVSINYIDCVADGTVCLVQLKDALGNPRTDYRDEQPIISAPTKARPDSSNRSNILQRVRSSWVDGVLEKSLHDSALIKLDDIFGYGKTNDDEKWWFDFVPSQAADEE